MDCNDNEIDISDLAVRQDREMSFLTRKVVVVLTSEGLMHKDRKDGSARVYSMSQYTVIRYEINIQATIWTVRISTGAANHRVQCSPKMKSPIDQRVN